MRLIQHYDFLLKWLNDDHTLAKVCPVEEADVYVSPSRTAYEVSEGVISNFPIGHFGEQNVPDSHRKEGHFYVDFPSGKSLEFFPVKEV